MMLALGLFVFQTSTLAYQELARRSDWRHADADRFGRRAARQFVGPGEDNITLPGLLYPGQVGDYTALARIRAMAATGEAFDLVTGYGDVLGQFTIASLDERQSVFFSDGAPRKVDFTIELKRFDDGQ